MIAAVHVVIERLVVDAELEFDPTTFEAAFATEIGRRIEMIGSRSLLAWSSGYERIDVAPGRKANIDLGGGIASSLAPVVVR
jgi:hypothetical protein